MINNKRIFITGGAGYLGKHLVERYYNRNKITIYSRDEAKHYYLKKKFHNIKCIIGDIRNYELMKDASKGHDIGIFTASLKQIESVNQNINEAIQIIINGAINSKRCAIENNFESSCFISSDKSRSATTLYGSMKFVAGESFIMNNLSDRIKLSTALYGNVTNSTGSIIPLIWNAIKNNYSLTLFSKEMTRFMIDIEEAINLIEYALLFNGCNIIPKLKSFLISDIFEIYATKFGLKYDIGQPRVSEKIHEIMISNEEIPRTIQSKCGQFYRMYPKKIFEDTCLKKEYSSQYCLLTKSQLKDYLEKNNYYENI